MANAKGKLAIHGGQKAVTVERLDRWEAMTEEMVHRVEQMVEGENLWMNGQRVARELEKGFAEFIGAKHTVSQHNGTSTLWAAYFAVGVGPGDEVIHPDFTWICSIAPAIYIGARPVFCEIDPKTFLIDPEDIEKRITPRTKAISLVHWGGNVCDMGPVMEVADRHGIPVIEDCSHAHGASYDGRAVGTIGAIGGFSFQGVPGRGKPICGGELGMVATMDRRLFERVLLLGHVGRAGLADELREPAHRRLAPYGLGLNFRPHPLALAIAQVQFGRIREQNAKRWAYVQKMIRGLEEIPGIDPLYIYPRAQPGGLFMALQARYRPEDLGGLSRETYCKALQAEGVRVQAGAYADAFGASLAGVRHSSYHQMPPFARGFDFYTHGRGPLWEGYEGYAPEDFPRTREALSRMLQLPILTDPEEGVVEQFLEAFWKVAKHYKSLL
jgi:dTDP-4-amino-4,6-dideoxygalactose transaminase